MRLTPKLLMATLLLAAASPAQQPSTQTAPLFAVNAQYVQGVAPGYWPTAGAGLVLNIAAGTAICHSAPTNYAGDALTLAPSATNYVYLDPAANCAPSFNTSAFPADALPLATVTTSASTITQVTDQRTWFTSSERSFLAATSFSATSIGAQIDAACASLVNKAGMVVVPSSMGAGQSAQGLANGCALLDLRGGGSNLTSNYAPDVFGDENQYQSPFLFRYRWTSPQPADPNALQVLQVFADYATGGSNCSPGMPGTLCVDGLYHKHNPRGLMSALVARTPSQSTGALAGSSACYSEGDCIALNVGITSWDWQNAGGDEGSEAVRVDAEQGSTEFAASVSSVSGSTVHYTAASNENTRGEQRLLVSTGGANSKVYSTGTVTGFSGSGHITVTGSGANWTGLDDGAHCFWMTHGADLYGSSLHHVFQIDPGSGGGGGTTLTISYFVENVGHPWSDDDPGTGSGGTGLYAIAPCSTVTGLGLSGSLTVANASPFAAGDAIFMPLGVDTAIQSGVFLAARTLPSTMANQVLVASNLGPRPFLRGLTIGGNYSNSEIYVGPPSGTDRLGNAIGPPNWGINFGQGNWSFGNSAFYIGDTHTSATTLRLIGVTRTNGSTAFFQYNKTGSSTDASQDTWSFSNGLTANPQSPPVLAANGENAADGLRINGSAGGASSGTGTTAGAGSSMTLYAGAGGTSSGGTNVTGGAAGSFAFRGATGGAGTGTGNGGAGSDFGVYLGAGGSGAAAGRNGKFFVEAQPTPTANVFSVEDSSQIDKVYVDSGFNLNAAANVVLKSAGSHLNASAGSNDFDGVISVSAATSASHTFSTAYASTPVCVLTPTSNPGSLTWWVTASNTAVTANLSAAGTITFNYHCAGNPN